MTRVFATRETELELLAQGAPLVGMDEVGRGALAGPVAVGACALLGGEPEPPQGLADSKLLSPRRRADLVEPVREWAAAHAVGWASNEEIDHFGIIPALRLAGMRALEDLTRLIGAPALVLLDGSHDWLTPPDDLLAELDGPVLEQIGTPPVVTKVKADASCTIVAAASILAKVARDEFMCGLDDPGYAWERNKGYASPAHVEGLRRHGPSQLHRRSWRLPGAPK